MGEGARALHASTPAAIRARAVALRLRARLPVGAAEAPPSTPPSASSSTSERARSSRAWSCAAPRPARQRPIAVVGEPADCVARGARRARRAARDRDAARRSGARRRRAAGDASIDRARRAAIAGGRSRDLVALPASRVLVVCADVAARRAPACRERLGGFALCSHAALERDPALADAYQHVVALDPPAIRPSRAAASRRRGWLHLAWGPAELRVRRGCSARARLRAALVALYRALRARRRAGDELDAALRGDGAHAALRAHAGRLLRVLDELGLVERRPRRATRVTVPPAERTDARALAGLSGRHCVATRKALRWLGESTARAA